MRIEKKAWPEYFQAVVECRKRFELRLADFECKPGDVLVLREWDPQKQDYTGRTVEKKVSYVLKTKGLGLFKQEDIDKYGYQIISTD